MYHDILYTISIPEVGQKIQGVSKASNRLVKTCVTTSVKSLGWVRNCEAFRCRTRHEAVYLVYVLPREADLGREFSNTLETLERQSRPPEHVCTHPHCRRYPGHGLHPQTAASLKHIRWLLIVLAVISLFLGSNGILGTQLWSLFLSLLRLLFPL